MQTKDGEDFFSEDADEDEYGDEGGEDELDEEADFAQIEAQLTAKQRAKIEASGYTVKEFLEGQGPELSDDYDDEEEGEAD